MTELNRCCQEPWQYFICVKDDAPPLSSQEAEERNETLGLTFTGTF
jgi:hypothetical protein